MLPTLSDEIVLKGKNTKKCSLFEKLFKHMTTQTAATTFTDLGVPQSLCDQLQNKKGAFRFNTALPVQQEVIPFANKAFSSWLLHCDIGLSSPTGSGKTLCYCLPMIHAILEQRKRFAPTTTTSSQNTNEDSSEAVAAATEKKKAPSVYVGIDRHLRGVIVVPTAILAEQVTDVLAGLSLHVISGSGNKQQQTNNAASAVSSTTSHAAASSSIAKTSSSSSLFPLSSLHVGTLFRASDDGSNLFVTKQFSSSSTGKKSFGTVDILVATPQKLCSWIERLADEDEDENEMESSNNKNNSKNKNNNKIVDIFGRTQLVVLDEADDLLSTGFFTSMAGRIVDTIQFAVNQQNETVLHKMLCSATLTARISKVSDVKLQNAKYFSLDSLGNEVVESGASGENNNNNNNNNKQTVRQKFPLPASLHEHLVIVRDDAKRHVTLLNVVRYALGILRKAKEDEQAKNVVGEDGASGDQQQQNSLVSSWKSTGSSIIVFCQTAEVARVMGHFLSLAGIDALELTTLTSDAERRQAALAVAAAKSSEQKVIVASDALMRGIDLPGVGAVIQYDPPQTLQQFVHRVGRTSRAGAVGHSFVLLSKLGFESGLEEDGQVAHFKSFDAMLLRKGKVENLVKLRELVESEVDKADEILLKTKLKLNGVGNVVISTSSSKQQQQVRTASNNNNKDKDKKHHDSKRRERV